jgi:hypothetical protein
MDPQPDLLSVGDEQQRGWELEDGKRGALVYDEERGEFEFVRDDGEFDGEESLYVSIKELIKELLEDGQPSFEANDRFKICPVFAARR